MAHSCCQIDFVDMENSISWLKKMLKKHQFKKALLHLDTAQQIITRQERDLFGD